MGKISVVPNYQLPVGNSILVLLLLLPSLANQFWILLPFFLLHAAAGLSGGFTSILLQHFEQGKTTNDIQQWSNGIYCEAGNVTVTWLGVRLVGNGTQCEEGKGDSNFIILLATAEDYAPIIISILSGFLQQWVGPKLIFQVNAVPAALSWIVVLISPESKVAVILSRFLAGLANGLLCSNVYAADISHRENRQSLKMIEGASRSVGFILIYVLQLIFWNFNDNISWISGVSLLLPCLSFVGMFFKPESTVFTARSTMTKYEKKINQKNNERIINPKVKNENNTEINNEYLETYDQNTKNKENSLEIQGLGKTFIEYTVSHKNTNNNNLINENNSSDNNQIKEKNQGKEQCQKSLIGFPPFTSPTIFRPFTFITFIIFLQHCSGFAFTKKLLLQLLKPKDPSSDPRLSTISAIAITTVRLFANLFMARLVKSLRMRGLFFFSLFSTSFCLITIGLLLDDCLDVSPISKDLKEYVTVVLLALHVFLVQFGLQNLSANLTDLLFPTMHKAVMKGILRAITSLTLILIMFLLTFNVNCSINFSVTFWSMAAILLCSTPLLWVFVPEIRNIGNQMAREFFQPIQTVFFFVILPKNRVKEIRRLLDPQIELKTSLVKFKQIIQKVIEESNRATLKIDLCTLCKYIALYETIEECAVYVQTSTFQITFYSKEDMLNDSQGADENKEKVSFIRNIHGPNGFLERNKNNNRVLIAKGPVKIEENFTCIKGGLFLFDDVVIISQCICNNMRYILEKSFRLSDKFLSVTREEEKIIFKNSKMTVCVSFEKSCEAKLWEKYVNFYKTPTSRCIGTRQLLKMVPGGDNWYVADNDRLCQNRPGAARPAGGDRPGVDRLGGAGGSGQHGVKQQLLPTFGSSGQQHSLGAGARTDTTCSQNVPSE